MEIIESLLDIDHQAWGLDTPETHSHLSNCRFIMREGGEKIRLRLLNNETHRRKKIRTLRCFIVMELTHEVLKYARYRHSNINDILNDNM